MVDIICRNCKEKFIIKYNIEADEGVLIDNIRFECFCPHCSAFNLIGIKLIPNNLLKPEKKINKPKLKPKDNNQIKEQSYVG